MENPGNMLIGPLMTASVDRGLLLSGTVSPSGAQFAKFWSRLGGQMQEPVQAAAVDKDDLTGLSGTEPGELVVNAATSGAAPTDSGSESNGVAAETGNGRAFTRAQTAETFGDMAPGTWERSGETPTGGADALIAQSRPGGARLQFWPSLANSANDQGNGTSQMPDDATDAGGARLQSAVPQHPGREPDEVFKTERADEPNSFDEVRGLEAARPASLKLSRSQVTVSSPVVLTDEVSPFATVPPAEAVTVGTVQDQVESLSSPADRGAPGTLHRDNDEIPIRWAGVVASPDVAGSTNARTTGPRQDSGKAGVMRPEGFQYLIGEQSDRPDPTNIAGATADLAPVDAPSARSAPVRGVVRLGETAAWSAPAAPVDSVHLALRKLSQGADSHAAVTATESGFPMALTQVAEPEKTTATLWAGPADRSASSSLPTPADSVTAGNVKQSQAGALISRAAFSPDVYQPPGPSAETAPSEGVLIAALARPEVDRGYKPLSQSSKPSSGFGRSDFGNVTTFFPNGAEAGIGVGNGRPRDVAVRTASVHLESVAGEGFDPMVRARDQFGQLSRGATQPQALATATSTAPSIGPSQPGQGFIPAVWRLDPKRPEIQPLDMSLQAVALTEPRSAAGPVVTNLASGTSLPAAVVVQQIIHASGQLARGPVEVSLSPDELGRVRMTLTPGENGMVLSILADRDDTLALLRRNVDLLSNDLRDLGYDNLSFQFGSGGSGDGHRDRGAEAVMRGADHSDITTVASQPFHTAGLSPDRLDLRL